MSDTGEGIEEGRLAKIFEKGETDGRTGLGLAIVRQVVEAHGGVFASRVRPERAPLSSSTFRASRLPACDLTHLIRKGRTSLNEEAASFSVYRAG